MQTLAFSILVSPTRTSLPKIASHWVSGGVWCHWSLCSIGPEGGGTLEVCPDWESHKAGFPQAEKTCVLQGMQLSPFPVLFLEWKFTRGACEASASHFCPWLHTPRSVLQSWEFTCCLSQLGEGSPYTSSKLTIWSSPETIFPLKSCSFSGF